jgi:hypothetical protein
MSRNPEQKPKCLVCENIADSSRGLCVSHYLQFTRKRKELIENGMESKAIAWEKHLVETGKLLPNRQGKKASDDVFEDDLNKFLASTSTDHEADADEIERVARKHAVKESAKKPTKTTKKKQA